MAYGTINALSLAGHRADGRRWVMFSFFGGGHGGNIEGDGLNHGNAPISTATIPPLEILEAAYPVMFTQWALRADSGGAGEHRGGLGAIYEIELLELEDDERVRSLLERFVAETGSKKAGRILGDWRHERMNFVRIETSEYQRVRDEAKGG